MALASKGFPTFVNLSTACAPTSAPLSPFQGLELYSHHHGRDVEASSTRMAMWQLQEDEKSCSLVLRSLWSEVGRLCNTYFKPAIELQKPADLCARWDRCNSVDRTGVAEKSPTKPTAWQSQQAEEKSVRFQGGEGKDRKGRRRGKARERCLWLRHHRRPSADRMRLLLHGHRCPCLPAPHSRRESLQRNRGSARFWDFSTSRTQTL